MSSTSDVSKLLKSRVFKEDKPLNKRIQSEYPTLNDPIYNVSKDVQFSNMFLQTPLYPSPTLTTKLLKSSVFNDVQSLNIFCIFTTFLVSKLLRLTLSSEVQPSKRLVISVTFPVSQELKSTLFKDEQPLKSAAIVVTFFVLIKLKSTLSKEEQPQNIPCKSVT